MDVKFINDSTNVFTDISNESYRIYRFPDNEFVRIDEPICLNVSVKSGGHRIFDASGKSHYIPAGWVHLFWEAKPGMPNFVK